MIMGKILRVNLTTKQITEQPYPEVLAQQFMGGAAAAIKLLYDEVDPGVDALGPDNKLIVSMGFLAGTSAPATSRVAFVAKSPLSGTVGYSNSGGFFPNELRAAGVQAIIVAPCALRPAHRLPRRHSACAGARSILPQPGRCVRSRSARARSRSQ